MKITLDQLKDYSDWKRVNDFFTNLHYIGAVCNFSHIISVSNLFFPDMVEVSECFFSKNSPQKKHIEPLWNNVKTIAQLEKTVNFICISDLTNMNLEKEDEALKEKIALFLKDIWRYYFDIKYKDKNIEIEVYNDEYDGWCITVYQRDKINHPKPSILPEW